MKRTSSLTNRFCLFYCCARSAIKERQLAEELEKGVEQRIELRVAAIAALSDAEKRLRSHRKHVIERILTPCMD